MCRAIQTDTVLNESTLQNLCLYISGTVNKVVFSFLMTFNFYFSDSCIHDFIILTRYILR